MNTKENFPFDKWSFKTQSVFDALPHEELDQLLAHQTEQWYDKGHVIFREGSWPAGIFLIKEGKVKKYKIDDEGGEQIIYVANTGELIGYHAILSEERYPDSVATLERSRLAFIPQEDFLAVIERSAVIRRRLLKSLSHEFAVLANSLSAVAGKPARERLALQLVLLSEKYKNDALASLPVEINLSREDLASMAGTVRENVVRILSDFKEMGIIGTQGRKILLYDLKKLIAISNHKG